MNCEICLKPFNNSSHEPYKLKLCSHNLCLDCLVTNIFADNKCPQCGILINGEFICKNDEVKLVNNKNLHYIIYI